MPSSGHLGERSPSIDPATAEPMNIAALLYKSASTFSQRPALALGNIVTSTYAEAGNRVARLAGGFKDIVGLFPGDRVAIVMKNCPEYCDVLFAAWHSGCAAVPMNAKLHEKEYRYMLEHSEAKLCFVTEALESIICTAVEGLDVKPEIIRTDSDRYQSLLASSPIELTQVEPDDLAWLFYTSGTTGQPKGAMLTHRNLLMMTVSYYGDVNPVDEFDTILHAAPMSHGSGIYILPYAAKGACQVIPESGGFDPSEILNLLQLHNNVSCFFAPTMVKRLFSAQEIIDADISGLKTIIYGGGPMYVEDCLKALEVLGPKFVQIYGQGEAPMTITALSRGAHMDTENPFYLERLASVGTSRTDLEVQVVDEDDLPLAVGEIGEVIVRGDVVMKGYWRNPKATDECLRGGWLHTGDIGSFDESGYLTLKDRSKDVIISGGSNVYPREVEEILLCHEGVMEVSVVGRTHPDWGEEVVAFIVSKEGISLGKEELDNLCLKNIARFKRPKEYRFIKALPKNNYGKVLKTELRHLLNEIGND